MRTYERVISIIMLYVMSVSNLATPVAYAAPMVPFHALIPKRTTFFPSGKITAANKILHETQGSVLGASTSLLNVGTQTLDIRQTTVASAAQRIPIQVQRLAKKVYRTDEDVTFAVTNPDNDAFTTSVTDASGKTVNVPITESNSGSTTTVDLVPSNSIKPGLYKVTITDSAKSSTEQDFTWGVLALNTDKSMYHPGDKADIAMAVLDDNGNMVCDAQVKLDIQDSSGAGPELSTSATGENQIIVNPQCQTHDFSLQPDYEGHYTFPAAGSYTLTLSATTANGTHTIVDSIQVKNDIPFDVQRVSATRIYPPNTYPMLFNITANQDFNGTVTETVPDSFTITPATASATQSYSDMQTVYLNSTDPTAVMSQQIASQSGGLVMPFHGSYPITQGFGAELTDPTLQAFYTHYGLGGHDGIDFGVPMNTPLYAVDAGTIIWSGPGDYGTMVTILHSWGQTYYGHMSNTSVKVGDQVTKGQLIGYSGMSGEATGPHLHFGMKPKNPDMTNGYYGKIDPMPFLPIGQGEPITALGAETNPVANLVYNTTVLGASDSAATPTPSDTPTPSGSLSTTPTPTAAPTTLPTATPTPAPTVSPTPSSNASSSAEETVSPTPTAIPSVFANPATANANTKFTVLDKEIQLNEQIANSALTEKVKIITWNVHLKKGEKTTLGYAYQIPQVSPQFYLLGPAKFYDGSNDRLVFQEGRSWELAADDVGVEWYQNAAGLHNWNGYSWQYRKKITINKSSTLTPALNSSAVAVNDSNNGTGTSATITNLTVSSSDTNRILVLGVGLFDGLGGVTVSTGGSAPTWGSQTFTKLSGATFDTSGVRDDELWYLVAPASGNQTLTVHFSGTTTYVIAASEYYNVNQTTPFGTVHTVTGTTTPPTGWSNPIPSGTNQLPIDVCAWDAATGISTSGTGGQVQVWNSDLASGSSCSSYAPSAGSTTTLTWNDANTENYYDIGVSLQPVVAVATPAYVQSAITTSGTSSTISTTFSSNTTAGDLIVVEVTYQSSMTVSSCTDAQGNAYTVLTQKNDTTNFQAINICYAPNIIGGTTDTVTVHFGGGSPCCQGMSISEYSGVATSNPVDVSASNFATGSSGTDTYTTTSATTTTSGDLIYGGMNTDAGSNCTTCNAGTGYTKRVGATVNALPFITEDKVQSTAGSVAATFSLNVASAYLAYMVAFKPASGTLSNFPVLIKFTDTDVKNHALSTGADILFTDSTGRNLLPYEIENYDSTTGAVTAWVQTDLSSSSSTIIYMYYGNPSAAGNTTTNSQSTWDSNYMGVYHLKDSPTTQNTPTLAASVENDEASSHTSPYTFTNQLTIPNGHTDDYLLVGITDRVAAVQPTSLTYNGTAMTFLGTGSTGTTTNNWFFYGLKAPSTGAAHSFVVSFSGTDWYSMIAEDWYNVNQTTPFGSIANAASKNNGNVGITVTYPDSTGTNITASAGPTLKGRRIVDFIWSAQTGEAPAGTQTSIQAVSLTGGEIGSSYLTALTSGNTATMSWPTTATNWWGDNALDLIGDSSSAIADSTSNASNGVPYNMASSSTTGEIYNGLSFDGSSTYGEFPAGVSGSNLAITGDKTVEVWAKATNFNQDSSGADERMIFDNIDGTNVYQLDTCQASNCGGTTGGFMWSVNDSTGEHEVSLENLSTSTWYHVVATYTASTHAVALYINGASVSGGGTPAFILGSSGPLLMGMRYSDSEGLYNGTLDEVRISNAVRSSVWIATEYSNESNPSGFITVTTIPEETKIYAPTMSQVMRHGDWFDSTGTRQPFVF